MQLKQKIEKLNKLNQNTLCLDKYLEWEVHAYGCNAPLHLKNHYPYFKDKDLEKAIDEALTYSIENQNKK